MNATWWADLVERHRQLLASKDREHRELAMQNLIHFARLYSEAADYERTAPRLLKIYRFDRHEGHRILALSALHAVGNERAIDQVRRLLPSEQSERVRRLTQLVLADYYKARQ